MKENTEKPPIDDLFARKLGNMSLSPSPDGFERLQVRMGQKKSETKLVVWRNPVTYGYVAAAACVATVFLFGWQYWPSDNTTQIGEKSVAVVSSGPNKLKRDLREPMKQKEEQATDADVNPTVPNKSNQSVESDQLAHITKSSARPLDRYQSDSKTARDLSSKTDDNAPTSPVLAQTTDQKIKPSELAPAIPVTPPAVDNKQPVVAINKPAPAAERVLEVTIAEPEALVTARQAAKASVEEKTVVASNEKQEKENKSGSLWQQVKRFKQGEVFARGENADNEQSLLGRAYNGLRHTLDKDKAAKQ